MKLIGVAALFMIDMVTTVLVCVLFGLVFVGVQVASWTGAKP